uniref:Uncharacterized protein n=1 Tax=Anguilla anguilla TaxID=7936 RepID=A0A0E9W3L4_ANGAN
MQCRVHLPACCSSDLVHYLMMCLQTAVFSAEPEVTT